MWFMNHIFNPLVKLILKSPLHGIMSPAVLLLTYRGKKSGKQYQFPVQYAQDGKLVYIIPGAPEQKRWWHNIFTGTPVQLVLRGRRVSGQADLLQGEKDEEAITGALKFYFQRFPPSAKIHKVHPKPDGSFAAEDLRLAARSAIVVRVTLK